MKMIARVDDSEIIRRNSVASGTIDPELVPGTAISTEQEEKDVAHLNKVAKIARGLTVFMTVALLVLWPMPMYGSKYVFSKKFFTGKQTIPFNEHEHKLNLMYRLGCGRHPLAVLQCPLRWYLPCLAGSKDCNTYHQVHVLGYYRQEKGAYSGSCARGQ